MLVLQNRIALCIGKTNMRKENEMGNTPTFPSFIEIAMVLIPIKFTY